MKSLPVNAVRVTVPASTANIGSGFDTLGMALGLYDVIEVSTALGGLQVEVIGEGAGRLPLDEDHLVVRAIRAAGAAKGFSPSGLIVRCTNAIPHSRGLGSSGAAVVAGLAAGYALAGAAIDETIIDLAAEFEGHVDNAAASLLGGAVIAWSTTSDVRRHHVLSLSPHPQLRAVALISDVESSTKLTRSLLPATVPHEDAVFAVSRAALAVPAITTRPDLLLPATDDRLHQDYREPAWPSTIRVVRQLRAHGLAAFVSGAGSTALILGSGDIELPVDLDLAGFQVKPLPIDRKGVQVTPLEPNGC